MPWDEKTAARLMRVLSKRGAVEVREMFGGLCFMVRGHMCCGLADGAFMVRVGPEQYKAALAQPHARVMDFTGRPLKGLVYVDPPGYRTDAALARWVQRGLDFIATLEGQARRKRTPAPRKRATPRR